MSQAAPNLADRQELRGGTRERCQANKHVGYYEVPFLRDGRVLSGRDPAGADQLIPDGLA